MNNPTSDRNATLSATAIIVWLSYISAVSAQPPAPVVVSPIVQRDVAEGATFVGTVLPHKKAIIGTAVDGRVAEVLFEEGDRVRAGQPLVQLLIDTISLEHQAAEAELEFRRQQLAELENGTRPKDIEQAKAKMLSAEARLKYLQARSSRSEKLFRTGSAVSEDNRDEATSAAAAAEQDLIESRAAYALAVEGARKEQIAQARAQTQMQASLVEKLFGQIRKHTIVSGFDGYVTVKRTELGQWVTKGDPVVEVVALDPVEVRAHIPEAHIPYVIVGKEVRVEVPSLPHRVFTGRVAMIIPEADDRSRTFPVKVRVDNPPEDNGPPLKAGMLARVTLPTGPKQQAMLVPKDALVLGGPQPVVFVVDADAADNATANVPNGKARAVPVEMGVPSGGWIQVTGALQEGQKVVVRGNERLRPGQAVMISGELPAEPSVASTKSDVVAPRP